MSILLWWPGINFAISAVAIILDLAFVSKKGNFIYDGGPTVITAPYLINELFELFEKDPKNYIKISPLKILPIDVQLKIHNPLGMLTCTVKKDII